MNNFTKFLDFDDFGGITLIKETRSTQIITSQKNISPFRKYIFKIFRYQCFSPKDQKTILNTFQQISRKKSQYLQSYKYISFSFQSRNFPTFSMNYISSKTLEEVLRTPELLIKFTIENILQCLFAVAEGMRYLHNHLICHGNLCPSNIIIDDANQFYLCDFGLYPIKKLYIKEEDMTNNEYKDPYFGNNCQPTFINDVYSYGVLMCDIYLSYLKVTKKLNQVETLQNFLKNNNKSKFEQFPFFCVEIIPACLNSFASERPTFNQIVSTFKNSNQKIFGFSIQKSFNDFVSSNYLVNLAMNNDAFALNKVGKMYEKGVIFDKDLSKALESYEKAARLNNSEAQNNYGVLLQSNKDKDSPDLVKGAHYLQLSAEQGNVHGMANYGIALLNGIGVQKNFQKAEEYLKKSAEYGCSSAQVCYGYLLLDNNPTTIEINDALGYIKKAMNQNNPDAYYTFGLLLQKGKYIEKNSSLAMEHFKIAADMGYEKAILEYASGNLNYEPRNEKVALKYYQIAFENGNENVREIIDNLKEKIYESNQPSEPSNQITVISNEPIKQESIIEPIQESPKKEEKEENEIAQPRKSPRLIKAISSESIKTEEPTGIIRESLSNEDYSPSFKAVKSSTITKKYSIKRRKRYNNISSSDSSSEDYNLNKRYIPKKNKKSAREPKRKYNKIVEQLIGPASSSSDEYDSNKKPRSVSRRKSNNFSILMNKLKHKTPIKITSRINLISVGEIVYDRHKYHTENYIYPVGYQIEKEYFSIHDPNKQTIYRSSIQDGGDAPIFRVECLDETKTVFEGNTPSKPWREVLSAIDESRRKHGIPINETNSISGPFAYAFSNEIVVNLIERLPNADRCMRYKFRKFIPQRRNSNEEEENENENENNDDEGEEENESENDAAEEDYEEEEETNQQTESHETDLSTSNEEANSSDSSEAMNINENVDLNQPTENLIKQGDAFLEQSDLANAFECYKEAVKRGNSNILLKCAEASQSFEDQLKYLELAIKEKIPMSFSKWRLTIMKRVSLTKDAEPLLKFAKRFEEIEDFSDAAIVYHKAKDLISSQICYERAKENVNKITDGYQQYNFAIFVKNHHHKDIELAKNMLQKAINNNVPQAESKIGSFLKPKSPKETSEAESLLAEGIDYYYGQNGHKTDVIKAIDFFQRASALGCPKADFYLGCHFLNPYGTDQLKKAADSNDIDAQFRYGYYLKNGFLAPMDVQGALHYFKLAADQGHDVAAYEYGKEMYANGANVEAKNEGVAYLKKAAEKAFPDAIYLYSRIIRDTNPDDSKRFFQYAIQKGSKMALDEKKSIEMSSK